MFKPILDFRIGDYWRDAGRMAYDGGHLNQ